MESIRVRAPASSANLGAGFDCFGIALEDPYDMVDVSIASKGGGALEISVEGYPIPLDPERNTGGYVALKMMEDFGLEDSIEIRIQKNIPPGSGLGSSAATASAVAYALNRLYDLKLSMDELVRYASLGEIVSAGTPHLDNVAPAIYGGFTIIAGIPPRIYSFQPDDRLGVVVILPRTSKASTYEARKILPSTIDLSSAYRNVGYGSLTVLGLTLGCVNLLRDGMRDEGVERIRASHGFAQLYDEVRILAEKLGVGVALSGAGPAYIAIAYRDELGSIAESFRRLFDDRNIGCKVYVTKIGRGVYEVK
ncbi:MAG: homoserine kinase [Candidatus Bathyarchaeia archaeon]